MNFLRFHLPKEILQIANIIGKAGHRAYVVGGVLRDHIMNRPKGNDIDLATTAEPDTIIGLFPRVVPTGIQHGTVTILQGRYSVEITTLRSEGIYSDARRPDTVEFVEDIIKDLSRRDFTMNAMAYEIASGIFYDPFHGREDIKRKLIRTVGEPQDRFQEDGLRILRAIRFAAQLNFVIEEQTFTAISSSLATLKGVSPERIHDELQKILLSDHPSNGLRLLESTGILFLILPELEPSRGCQQKGMHKFDVLDHLFASTDASPPAIVLRLSALFHDAGKPASKSLDENGIPTFYGHEKISVRLAEKALKRLRFPRDIIERTCHLIDFHMFNYSDTWTDSAVRRIVAKVGLEHMAELLALRASDTAGMSGTAFNPISIQDFEQRIAQVLQKDTALSIRDLAINGEDLASLGIPRGPVMGEILKYLLETVLDDPSQNKKEQLVLIVNSIKEKFGVETLKD
jgi:poly(A) polymerase/tRNA nucleotidyltransferase (CCA-adding enzyme)